MITERGNRRCCRLQWQIAPAECQREEGEEGRRPPRSERASAVSSARVDLIASNRRKGFNLVEFRGGGREDRGGGEIPAAAAVDVVAVQLLFTPSLPFPRREK